MNRYFLTVFTLCTTIAVHAQVDRNTLRNGAPMKFVPGTSIMNTTPSAGTATMPMGSSLIMKPVTDLIHQKFCRTSRETIVRTTSIHSAKTIVTPIKRPTSQTILTPPMTISHTEACTVALMRASISASWRPLASMLRMALALHSKSMPPISPRSASMDGWQQEAICSILTGTGPMSQAVDCMPNWAIGSTIIGQPTSTDRRVW